MLNQITKICDISSDEQCFKKYNKHLVRWLYEWKGYNGSSWGELNLMIIWALNTIFDDEENTVIPSGMIRPNWEERKYLYKKYYGTRQLLSLLGELKLTTCCNFYF